MLRAFKGFHLWFSQDHQEPYEHGSLPWGKFKNINIYILRKMFMATLEFLKKILFIYF